jgi:hypothetical protein
MEAVIDIRRAMGTANSINSSVDQYSSPEVHTHEHSNLQSQTSRRSSHTVAVHQEVSDDPVEPSLVLDTE